ncbi:hypothetical protein [Parapedobacter tibetensis]|uniref:hypothetical protein n=1 Tax=Parapedobacter tibetensis TaxID=2972951 RepID=UPI00214DCBB4|nr:hypothetical protein [Parapedobacter tibetensis]
MYLVFYYCTTNTPAPKNITHEQAAVSTLAALTALQPIHKVGIEKGDRVFVTAAVAV